MASTIAVRTALILAVLVGIVGTGLAERPFGIESSKSVIAPHQLSPLRDVIVSTIATETWDDFGGDCSIHVVDSWGVAIVTTTADVHSQIQNLLATIRDVRQMQGLNDRVPERIRNGAEVLSADDATRKRQINAALDTEMNIEVESQPLRDVVRRLERTHGIEFEIDVAGLQNIGLQADAPVTANLANTPLRSGLELLLRDLGLGYFVAPHAVTITSLDESEVRMITVVYPIKDLAVNSWKPNVHESSLSD